MKEIGGYLEFEKYHGKMLHSDGIKLNCGRNCLAYLILARKIKKIAVPYFMCDAVFDVCKRYGTEIHYYHVNEFFLPENLVLENDEWMYIMNFYGQLATEVIEDYVHKYKHVIADFAHDYFHEKVKGADTIYTCRKFFGVSDGAILYTNAETPLIEIEIDESFERINYLFGRYERIASEFYDEFAKNNTFFADQPIKKMSKITENFLHSFDYEKIKRQRSNNFHYLHERLHSINMLELQVPEGAYAYPLMVNNGAELKKQLINHNIFIPTLWPNVLQNMQVTDIEHRMVKDILPLPCDQRYLPEDMQYMVNLIFQYQNN